MKFCARLEGRDLIEQVTLKITHVISYTNHFGSEDISTTQTRNNGFTQRQDFVPG